MTVRDIVRTAAAPILVPQYVPVPIPDPQPYVTVLLRGPAASLDVTRNNFVVSMKPLVFGVHLADAEAFGDRARLEFQTAQGAGESLGAIELEAGRVYTCNGLAFQTFRPAGSRNLCVAPRWRAAYRLRERFKARRHQRRNPHNLQMAPRDLEALFVFYACPRPVVLVSVADGPFESVFPMDLIGPTASPLFSLALRTTSPAVEAMKASARFALANIPAEYKDIAYELGARRDHPGSPAGWPFQPVSSSAFGLPVPREALRVREVQVEQAVTVGSHCWFLTRVVTDTGEPDGARAQSQLNHIHGACHRRFVGAGVLR